MNELDINQIPPNVTHLQRAQFGKAIPADTVHSSALQFKAGSTPFFFTIDKTLTNTCSSRTYGFILDTDRISGRVFISDIKINSSASKLFSTLRATRNKLRGSFITRINNKPIFTMDTAIDTFRELRNSKTKSFNICFAPEHKDSAQDIWRAAEENNLYSSLPLDMRDLHHSPHVQSIDIADLRHIAMLKYPKLKFDDDHLSTETAHMSTHAIRSQATTDEELAL